MIVRTIDGKELNTRAAVSSVDAKERTVDLAFTTGAKGKRSGWLGDEWFEELEVSPSALRMDRLNSGAPLLDSHRAGALGNQIGVVVRAWIEKGVGMATVKFSDRAEVQGIWKDVQDGIIRNVSVGYRVHKWADVTEGDDKIKTYRAVDWEPMEVSLVPIGFDAGAQVRSAENSPFTTIIESPSTRQPAVEVKREIAKMDEEQKRAAEEAKAKAAQAAEVKRAAEEAVAAEQKRVADITAIVKRAKLQGDVEKFTKPGVSVEQARELVLTALAERDASTDTRGAHSGVESGTADCEKRAVAVENAILHRGLGEKAVKLEAGRDFRSMSLLEIGRRWLEAQGRATGGMSPRQLAGELFRAGGHTTSDFSHVLANVATKSLMMGYDTASALQTFTPFVKFGSLPNFLAAKRVGMGEAPNLVEVAENGEIPQGTSANTSEEIQLASFGSIFNVTRQAIINDELGALTDMPNKYGAAAARLESDKVYAVLTANADMADSNPLFDSAHANVKTSGGAIDVSSLAYGFSLLRKQTGRNADDVLNIMPKFLVVPAAIEAVARQYTTVIGANAGSSVNPFAGRLEVICDARLDANDANAWYLIADPREGWPTIELATLDGVRAPHIETQLGFEVDGLKVKATHDVAAKALDWRTMFMNDGGT
jgi:hypothetical protein